MRPVTSWATWSRRGLFVLVAAAIALLLADPERVRELYPRPDVEVFDVGARALTLAASPEKASQVDPYDRARNGAAHLHVIGKGEVVELHLHEETVEVAVPVMGRPTVTQAFAGVAPGTTASRRSEPNEGDVIVSPPDCAHEWRNPSAEASHASLVFTLGAPFPGNLFVRGDDPRIATGRAPLAVDVRGDRDRFVASGEPSRVVDLEVTRGRLAVAFVKDRLVLETRGRTLLYAALGKGRVEVGGSAVALSPKVLVVARRAGAITIETAAGEPLAVYVVRYAE